MNTKAGHRLHVIREHRQISQSRIAGAIGVSVGTIQNYEHGRVAITTDRIEQLARALQCEPTDLLAPPEAPPPRYHRPRYKRITTLAIVAALTAPAIGPPQLILDLEHLADHPDRIDADDPA